MLGQHWPVSSLGRYLSAGLCVPWPKWGSLQEFRLVYNFRDPAISVPPEIEDANSCIKRSWTDQSPWYFLTRRIVDAKPAGKLLEGAVEGKWKRRAAVCLPGA